MKKLILLVPAILLFVPLAFGQKAMEMNDAPMVIRHGTLELLESASGKQALEDYHRMKRSGQLLQQARKRVDEVGDTVTFTIFNFSSSTNENHPFVLKRKLPLFQVWVEVAELNNSNVTEASIDALLNPLGVSTPPKSYNSSKGIIENNNDVFGAPPNVDGDGLLDVFLLDVRDDYNGSNGFVAGYFSPQDLTGQNNRDIIYIDTNPGFSRGTDKVAQTLAHEYQHLIHAEYDISEETFVNEGQSEWAEVMNGYDGRNIGYLNDVSEHATDLYTWRSSNPFFDYQRGKLLTTYLAEQNGVLTAGSITRAPQKASAGYRSVLGSEPFKTALADFHTANFVNDTSIDAAYGHTHGTHTSLSTPSDYQVDGRTTDETSTTNVTLAKGGAYYATWDNVADLTVNVASTSTRLVIRVVSTINGTTTVSEVSAGSHVFSEEGDYTFIFVDTNPSGFDDVTLTYDASWAVSGGELISEKVQFDNGQLGATPFSFGSSGEGRIATIFEVPFGSVATLDKVEISPAFFSYFSNSGVPETAPRDLALKVWSVVNSEPAVELYSKDLVDPRGSTALFQTLEFFEVDLSDDALTLTGLPDSIAIGYAEIGTDNNYFVVAAVDYTDGNVSMFSQNSTSAWVDLYDTTLNGGESLDGHAVPVRPTFLLPRWTGVDDGEGSELPTIAALDQNYPNPFNPATTISFSIPTAGHVNLVVYDVLGREVETLVSGPRAAGTHEVVFDAQSFSSGTYLYRLETATTSLTRTMLLLK